MPNVKKAMRTVKPTKDDPPGTRFIGGKKIIPYVKTPVQEGARTGLSSGYQRARDMGGGIVPGAQKNTIPPISNPLAGLGKLFKKKPKK